MNFIWDTLQRLFAGIVFWVIVTPWEQAIRVRAGRHVRQLTPGIHWKIPVLDTAFKQSVRMRITALHMQTLTTQDGKTVTLSGAVGYAIDDLERLYRGLHHAEETIRNIYMGAIARYICSHDLDDCSPGAIEANAAADVDIHGFGLGSGRLYVTDFVVVRTYRLIMDSKWGGYGDYLETSQVAGVSQK